MTYREEADEKIVAPAGFTCQKGLYVLVREIKPKVVVETGYGYSTRAILKALCANGHGLLYTCDPSIHHEHVVGKCADDEAARWTMFRETSYQALPKCPAPWDVFVHDSNHSAYCVTYELEYALACAEPGGVILCDDTGWGAAKYESGFESHVPHFSWHRFLERHNLLALPSIDSFACTRKPMDMPIVEPNMKEILALALDVDNRYRASVGAPPRQE